MSASVAAVASGSPRAPSYLWASASPMFAHPHARGLWPYNLHTFMPATADAATDGVASLRPAQLEPIA